MHGEQGADVERGFWTSLRDLGITEAWVGALCVWGFRSGMAP